MSSIVEIINHYQKSIDRSLNDETRLLHCIAKLYRLPVSVEHLKDTGIGRTVNGLRKYDGEVGVAAKALVTKWKNMVAAEESEVEEPGSESHNQHREEDEQQDEDNCDESRLQVDEDRHSDDHHDDHEEEEDEQEVEQHHQQEEESDNEESHEQQEPEHPEPVRNGHDSDHRSERSSHRDSSDRHSSRSSSKHKSDRHHGSSSSKDSSRSRDRHEKHRDGDKSKHHSSGSSSSSSNKSHSSPAPSTPSSKKSSRHGDEGKDKKDKHSSSSSSSSRKDSSHTNGKESSHSSSKEKGSPSEKHHSRKEREELNGFTKEDDGHKRKRTSEDEEESAVKKSKNEHTSESKSKTSSSRSDSSSSGKDRSSSKSSKSGSSKDKDKKSSSEKKKESTSKKKKEQQQHSEDEADGGDSDPDNSAGASFADALAMIGMPSSSKKKTSSKGDKVKISTSSSMPPPPAKSDKHRSSSSSSSSSKGSSSGYSSASSTPSLLAQKPSPLPMHEIVESLPLISPNYKPMPLNQTVMECVFSNNGKPQKRALTEEEALGQSMQSKNLRTKVYSGVKNISGEVPTLYNMCIRLLQEHIDLIDYTGGIPFDLLKPVLERATPDQLFTLENYNPYLMEDSDVLWEQHIKRNFRSQKRKEEECESWREMFIRCSEERESKLQSLMANIKQSQEEKKAPIRKTQLAYVDSAVKPPRNIISKQARYGTAQAPVVSPAARVAALKNGSTNVAKAGDTRLKVAAGARDNAQAQVFHPTKPRKAPLMSKVMQSIKGFKGFRR